MAYAEHLCQKIITNHDNARQLVTKLSHIYCQHATDNPLLGIWDAINDDLHMQEAQARDDTDPALLLKKQAQYLRTVAEQWLQLTTQSIPADFLASYWCPSCRVLIRATWRQQPVSLFRRLIRREPKDNISRYQPLCCNCQSSDIFAMISYEGRELWLQR